jgi:hypothetical protein
LGQRSLRRCLAAFLLLTLTITTLTSTASAGDLALDPAVAPPPIPDIWARVDGPAARTGDRQSWLWGPVIHAITHEPYYQSPGGARKVFYFDKARMEINDPSADWSSPWYATSGLLVREMILGRIQIGDAHGVWAAPAEIPITGDLRDNPNSPTYATLSMHTSIGPGNADRRAEPRVGATVSELLRRDGTVQTGVVQNDSVRIAAYDEKLGHNVPDVFHRWIDLQPLAREYLFGYAITEPYWVETRVAGVEQLVLVQAFERRVLTYTPNNPDGWKVEAGNAGLHYRAWRGLTMPDDEALVPLAYGVPLGEIITDAALRHSIDPYLFAALAQTASGFDPLAHLTDIRIGVFGVPTEYIDQRGARYPYDPSVNAELAATLLAALYAQTSDWDAAVGWYLSWTDGAAALAADASLSSGDVMVAWSAMRDEYEGQPYPFPDAPPEPPPPPPPELRYIGAGPAAYYASGYTPAWFEHTLGLHASWGHAVPGWQPDPNGYYCVHPDFRPGQRLQLSANGVTLWCTIGDMVNPAHVGQWRSRWAVELGWNTFVALRLTEHNHVEVRAPR